MAYLSQSYRITSVAPLFMHNGQTRDPLNPFAKAMKKVSSKRNKTDADYEEMAHIEWTASLYLLNGEPCLPGENWETVLLEAGRKRKLGKQVQAGLFCPNASPLEYKGPRTVDELWADDRFRRTDPVRVQRNAVMRTRAYFTEWACTVEVNYDPQMIDLAQLTQLMVIGGESVGVGDWRPKFGRFNVMPVD